MRSPMGVGINGRRVVASLIGREILERLLTGWESFEVRSFDVGPQLPNEPEKRGHIDRLFHQCAHMRSLRHGALIRHSRQEKDREERIDFEQSINAAGPGSQRLVEVNQHQIYLGRISPKLVDGFFPIDGQDHVILLGLEQFAKTFTNRPLVVGEKQFRSHTSVSGGPVGRTSLLIDDRRGLRGHLGSVPNKGHDDHFPRLPGEPTFGKALLSQDVGPIQGDDPVAHLKARPRG